MKPNIILDLPPQVDEHAEVSIDLELYGMRKWRLHRDNEGRFASLQICINGEDVYVITDQEKVSGAMERIAPAFHIFHSGDFDIRHLRRWATYNSENFGDTLYFDRILSAGLYDTYGLKDLSRRYLSILVDKKEREEFFSGSEMTREMLEYAALDAQLTWHIYQEQKKVARVKDWYIWETVDRPALLTLLKARPFHMDADKWRQIAVQKEAESEKIRSSFSFNPGSWQQIKRALFEMGIDVPSTGEEVLQQYNDHTIVQEILKFKKLSKMTSTYGLNFLEKHLEDGNFAYPHIVVTKAETGRSASDDFNCQNIPSDPEYRSCFTASDEDHVLLMLDYIAQEPHITAYESQDKNLLAAIQPGRKVHVEVGKLLFKDPKFSKRDPRYKVAKSLNLGLSYGLSPAGLKRKLHDEEGMEISYAESEELVRQYFRIFPGVEQYIRNKRRFAELNGYVETKLGRRAWVNNNSYHSQNNAINSPIQGGGADILKRAMARYDRDSQRKGLEFSLMAPIHDELVFETHKDCLEETKALAIEAMTEEAEKVYPVSFEVEVFVGNTWVKEE